MKVDVSTAGSNGSRTHAGGSQSHRKAGP
jgi:hypothetical protein